MSTTDNYLIIDKLNFKTMNIIQELKKELKDAKKSRIQSWIDEVGRRLDIAIEEKEEMLSNEDIAERLLSDLSYRENIKEIIIGRLMDSSYQRVYWDAWFRGAEGKDLELAVNGVPFYKKNK